MKFVQSDTPKHKLLTVEHELFPEHVVANYAASHVARVVHPYPFV